MRSRLIKSVRALTPANLVKSALLILALGATSPSQAHDFWLQPARFNLSSPGTTSVSLQVGHGVNRQKSLITADRITRFDRYNAAGRSDWRNQLRLGDPNSDTPLTFSPQGLQTLVFDTNGTYSELPGIRFNDYLKAEGLTPAIQWRSQYKKTDQPGKEIYSRRAKSLIQVGPYAKSDDAVAMKLTGQSLEIVPEINPYAPAFTGTLPVRVYYYGKPLSGAKVMINNLDFDARPVGTAVSDKTGRASFRIPRNGLWQVNVIWTRPLAGDPKADFETLFSSLSFGYPPGSH